MVSVAALLILITTGMSFYSHQHHQLLVKSITKDLQSPTTTDLITSVGPMVVSTSSSVNILFTERQVLQDPIPHRVNKVSPRRILQPGSGGYNDGSGNKNISPLERQALHELYDSTDGPNWYYDNVLSSGIPWDFFNPDANPCDENWHGITCSPDYHVIELNLRQSDLSGTLPATIGQLSYLQGMVLDLMKSDFPTWDDDPDTPYPL